MSPKCRFFVPSVALYMLGASTSAYAQTPDAAALLRGAEQARRAIRSGTLELTCEFIHHGAGHTKPRKTRVRIVFDGTKRTVHQYQYEFSIAADPGRANDPANVEARPKQFDALGQDMDKAAAAGLGTKTYVRRSLAFDG